MLSLALTSFLLPLFASAATLSPRATTLIPSTCFDSTTTFEKYFVYTYPWGGTTHNGGARMDKAHVSLSSSVLTLTAQKVSGQPSATHGGKTIPINYLSGAVGAKQTFTVPKSGGLVFSASLKATTTKGTWPAFWLTAVDGWPPEVDMAEWKGNGKVSFNTFNTSSVLQWKDVGYPDPGNFHEFRTELRDVNGKDVKVELYMDGKLQATQVGGGYTGKALYLVINLQMEGSSGSPGPAGNMTYSIKDLVVSTL
ncbi:putative glycoside hydrolase [Clohesyomyces aquaticus]|uniref:Putative glycoside hydrolase n=1 Tax=Clohesyomyces aquaticus TaxID=1231657 RepID=A0A1Y1ZJE8_9PLEO|nr:putative glycoside hydrolase [Clohesyomyces aquaticus]